MTAPDVSHGRAPYLPAIDGLRALAVIAVLFFHGGFRWAKGGFLGVSVFFTLSGFLITTLLLRERDDTGTISLRRFWGRRARRLLPAALVCLAAISLLDRAGLLVHRAATRVDLVAALANVANWRFYASGQSYGQIFLAPSPAQHYWSLAIEEQFYLLLPVVAWLLLVRRGWSRRAMLLGAAGAYVGFTVLTIVTSWRDPDLAYYATFARAPELLAGVCLALAMPAAVTLRTEPRKVAIGADDPAMLARWGLTAAGFAAVAQFLAMTATVDQRGIWLSRGGLCAFAVLSVVLIAAALLADPVRTLLSVPPLPWLGRLSYGIYLYHWPVFLVLRPTRLAWSRWALFGLRVPVTVAVAAVSYYLIEQPVRNRRWVRGRAPWVAVPAAGFATAALAIALTGPLSLTASAGDAKVLATVVEPASDATVAGVAAAEPLAAAASVDSGVSVAATDSTSSVTTGAASSTAVEPSTSEAAATSTALPARPLRILVAGDSTAEALAPGLASWAADTGAGTVVTDAIRVGCGFVTDGRDKYGAQPRDIGPICGKVQDHVESTAASSDADVAVVIDGVWEVTDHQAPGDAWRAPGDPVFDRRLGDALRAVTTKVLAHVPTVVWVTSPVIHPGWGFAGDDPAWDPARMARYNALLRGVVAEFGERVVIVDYAAWMDDGRNGMNPDVRPDGVHASPAGARIVADWLGPRVVAAAAAG